MYVYGFSVAPNGGTAGVCREDSQDSGKKKKQKVIDHSHRTDVVHF